MIQSLSVQDLQQFLQNSVNFILIDVREPWEYEVCHIEPSILIPMNTINTTLHKLNKSQKTALICHHGVRSLQVAYFLKINKFLELYNVVGGIHQWAMEIDKTMATY